MGSCVLRDIGESQWDKAIQFEYFRKSNNGEDQLREYICADKRYAGAIDLRMIIT